ncbi:hypothetical protein SDC9_144432 [bioreactor metagenome]|uniref:Uncharacterized protein n=1 Tax=bioreactor metagenome TaxID=1076179 RepID=A0A645E6U7_9ZZZZ
MGGGQARGKAQAQKVLSLRENLPHFCLKSAHVDGGGGARLSRADLFKKLRKADFPPVQIVVIFLLADVKAQGKNLQLQLCRHVGGQVTAAVGQNYKVAHYSASSSFFCRLRFSRTGFSSISPRRWRSSVTYRRLAAPAA